MANSIENIDKNFETKQVSKNDNVREYNVLEAPFSIHGVMHDEKGFYRLPQSFIDLIPENKGVPYLSRQTAGGRIRFRTNSPFVSIRWKTNEFCLMPHMTAAGSIGFDMYADDYFAGSFFPTTTPATEMTGKLSLINDAESGKMHDILINMPLYNFVNEVYIGLSENAVIEPPKAYTYTNPVVFYGSSITQGGCASRPGTCYEQLLSRKLDFDYVNLGFSGNGFGEIQYGDYIASLNPSVFVMDYDYNACGAANLREHHEPLFKRFRSHKPDVPVIMMSTPGKTAFESVERLQVIKDTYQHAVDAGDKNVYILNGREFFEDDECTVDRCHPTDRGFAEMAKALYPVLKQVLK